MVLDCGLDFSSSRYLVAGSCERW